jgi:hypothetical protein
MKNKFIFDERILLHLALEQLRVSREQFERQQHKKLNLLQAQVLHTERRETQRINPNTGLPMYSDNIIWATPSHTIMTTQYNKIKRVERRAPKKPSVTIKRKIKIERTQGM